MSDKWDSPEIIEAMRELYSVSQYIECLLKDGGAPDETDVEQLGDALFKVGDVTGWDDELDAALAQIDAAFDRPVERG